MVARVLPTPSELVANLDREVAGQALAKRTFALAIYRHYMMLARAARPDLEPLPAAPGCTALLGPSGVGKTLMANTMAKCLGVPIHVASATSLSETGYVGENVDDLVGGLLRAAKGDVRFAQRGIVLLDEVDKLRASRMRSRDVSGRGVQNGLLTLIEGRTIRLGDGQVLHTGSIFWIFAGAFVGIDRIVQRRLARGGGIGDPRVALDASAEGLLAAGSDDLARLGFGADFVRRVPPRPDAPSAPHAVMPEDLIRFGLIPELVGRIRTLAVLHPLEREDLRAIVNGAPSSTLRRERALFAAHGIALEVSEDAIDWAVERAYRMRTGARGLDAALRGAIDPVAIRLEELQSLGVTRVGITAAVIRGEAPPEVTVGGDPPYDPAVADELRGDALDPVGAPLFKRGPKTYGEELVEHLITRERHRRTSEARDSRTRRGGAKEGADSGGAARGGSGATSHREWWTAPVPGEAAMRAQIVQWKKHGFGWTHATGPARLRWKAFEDTRPLDVVFRVAREIVARGGTMAAFVEACDATKVRSIRAAMDFMSYRRFAELAAGESELRALLLTKGPNGIPEALRDALLADVFPDDD